MALYRFKMKDEDDVICHYGRSIKDGAPGIGTGNWRRSGGEPIANAVESTKESVIQSLKTRGYEQGQKSPLYLVKKKGRRSIIAPVDGNDEALKRVNKIAQYCEKNFSKIIEDFEKAAKESFGEKGAEPFDDERYIYIFDDGEGGSDFNVGMWVHSKWDYNEDHQIAAEYSIKDKKFRYWAS